MKDVYDIDDYKGQHNDDNGVVDDHDVDDP